MTCQDCLGRFLYKDSGRSAVNVRFWRTAACREHSLNVSNRCILPFAGTVCRPGRVTSLVLAVPSQPRDNAVFSRLWLSRS